MSYHKRVAADRDITFRRPDCACLACNDTGLLSNSDGLLREYLPDYDTMPNGTPMGGHDLALVCWCVAAYAQHGPDGQLLRAGFREDSGDVRKVQTSNGLQALGSSLSKEVTRELHTRRRERWQETERQMTQARQSGEAPWFITESKAALQAVPQSSSSGLQSLGSILGTELQQRAD